MSSTSALMAHFWGGEQHLPDIAPLRRLSDSVFAVLAMNPSPFSLSGTNTYLIGTGAKRILVDTGEGKPEYIENLERALAELGVEGLQEIVVTHWHHDHLGGVPSVVERFGEVPVRKFMPQHREGVFGGEGAVDPDSIWPASRFCPLHDGEFLRTEGATLRVIHAPGHASDHVVLHHIEDRAFFTGDNVLGIGTTILRDLTEYMASLQLMLDIAIREGVTTLHPAHGPMISDAHGKLTEYIRHRRERIEEVCQALSEAPREGITCIAVARRLYAEVPERLLPAAAFNTLQALLKLEREGVAVRRSGGENSDAAAFSALWALGMSKL